MGRYLKQAASLPVLTEAWQTCRRKGGVWIHGFPSRQVAENPLPHLVALSREIRSGTYRPQPLRCFRLTRKNGEPRRVCAATLRDKVAQRAVLLAVEPLGEAIFHPASLGYRPGCTVDMALARVREQARWGYLWFAEGDVSACFDEIPHKPLLTRLARLCGDRALVRLVELWLAQSPHAARDQGISQGMVLSPFLCNLYLHDVDAALDRRNIPFVRYADDILVLGQSENQARSALAIVTEQLERLGLGLNATKTRLARLSRRHRFLGKRLPQPRRRFLQLLRCKAPNG